MTDLKDFKAGDTVTVRGTVKRSVPGVGLLVELFSKTDQYEAWIRADLVAEHSPKPACPPEPEPGAYHLNNVTGWDGPLTVLRFADSWIATTDWMSWEGLWKAHGGPDVTITKLVPALPEVELPWTGSIDGASLDVGGGSDGAIFVEISVPGSRGLLLEPLTPDDAEAMAHAIFSAARAARRKP